MKTFVLATANPDKAREIEEILRPIGITLLPRPVDVPDVTEDGETLEDNALLKARALVEATGRAAIADDTGLFVDALSGAPGVYSARYAGERATYSDNCRKLLRELEGVALPQRSARFRTVAAVAYPDGSWFVVDGEVEGLIAESELGRGSRLTVRLPRAQLAHVGSPPGVSPESGAQNAAKVLYIEDNPVNAILVQQLLAGWPDVEVVVATTGADGIVQARQLRPDLVLLDMNLPDMGGADVLRRLRSEDATRGLRVIALSAATLQEDVDAAKAAGADAYWTKPIDFVQVLQGVEAALSGR